VWLPLGYHMLTFYHPDYAPFTMNVSAHQNQTHLTNITLVRLTSYSLDATLGATIIHQGTSLYIPPSLLVDSNGLAYNGMVTAKIGYLDSKN
jgi:hypothetical protein